MPLMTPEERRLAEAVSRLAYCNPFLPERLECERAILGADMTAVPAVWSRQADMERNRVNVDKILMRADRLIQHLRRRLTDGNERRRLTDDDERRLADAKPAGGELALYEDLCHFLIYHRFFDRFRQTIAEAERRGEAAARVDWYDEFMADWRRLLDLPGAPAASLGEAPHFFACFFQLCRAFHHVFDFIIGGSMPAARLRAAVWQSIFTHDMRRYRRVLFDRMADLTTLITGPSGAGKELVARAIGLSRYIPFDAAARRFVQDFASSFYPLNITALAPTLIESELFGHRRGAFTGAIADRAGWLEICPPLGAVFLDEIGDIDGAIQVKLLRVLQTRSFQRLGESRPRRFAGKIIAATNRDLASAMREGRFRDDLYYRLCSDMIAAPSLGEQIRDTAGELGHLVGFLCVKLIGEDEAGALAAEVCAWIEEQLGRDYAWPGNVRELEQCVRNILVRREYRPLEAPAAASPGAELAARIDAADLTADELLGRYCAIARARLGSWQETARRLGLDHRTVKARADRALLARLTGGAPDPETESTHP